MKTETSIPTSQTSTGSPQWTRALELWLGSRKSANTRAAYAAGLRDLLVRSGTAVYAVERTDVARWVEGMRRRGLSEATVQLRVSGVASFYRYAAEECGLGGASNHWNGNNPAGGQSLRRRVEPYGKANWISADEARAILASIDRTSERGLRNFALIAGYLLLGRRNSEWRQVKWGDLERRSGLTWSYRWSGKGKKEQRADLPRPVMDAVCAYLQAAERKLEGGDYVFIGSDNGRPIAASTVRRMLKTCAARAGLDPERVRVHSLRHTAAMLRKEAGDGLEKIMGQLGHSSLAITQIYLHSLEGQTDTSWGTVAEMLGL